MVNDRVYPKWTIQETSSNFPSLFKNNVEVRRNYDNIAS